MLHHPSKYDIPLNVTCFDFINDMQYVINFEPGVPGGKPDLN